MSLSCIPISALLALALALAVSSAVASPAALPTPTVNLGYATYAGVLHPLSGSTSPFKNTTTFLGIRFAAPPMASLRWQAPQAPAHTAGVQLADTQPVQCEQAGQGSSLTNPVSGFAGIGDRDGGGGQLARRQSASGTSEDCLFLNVYVPGASGHLPRPASLPVIVWIHGGGYIAQNEATVNGTDLVLDAQGEVVVVTIQYRLGLFGFLAGKEVRDGGVLNAGLLDQVKALEWVQEHIVKFGGSPSQVTIWGESAGAGSVLQHIIANNGATSPPLFRAAITSSTFLPSQYRFDHSIPEALYAEVVSGANCTNSSSTFECLQQTPVSTLTAVNIALNSAGFFGTFVFVPVVDGSLITDSPTRLLGEGKVNGEVLLSITNTYEGHNFVSTAANGSGETNTTRYAQQLFPFMSDEQANTVAGLYAPVAEDPWDRNVAIMGEAIFICPTYLLLNAFDKVEKKAWKGEFAVPPGYHGFDLPYYFTDTTPPYPNADFQQAFSQSFASTAINLNPNDKINSSTITPSWPTYDIVNGTEMLFNSTDGNAGDPVVHTLNTDLELLQRCGFWWSVANVTAQ